MIRLFCLLFLVSCGPTAQQIHQDNQFHQSLPTIWSEIDTIGVLTMENIVFTLAQPCDSCTGASASHFAFEYHTALDSILRSKYQKTPQTLYPGVYPSLEKDSAMLKKLQLEIENHPYWQNQLDTTRNGLLEKKLTRNLLEKVALLGSMYQSRYIIHPLFTEIQLEPKDGQNQGKVNMSQNLSLYDTHKGQLLFWWKDSISIETPNEIDRAITPLFLNQSLNKLDYLLLNHQEILEPK